MPPYDYYTLPDNGQTDVDAVWFDKQSKRWPSAKHETLRAWYEAEVKALRDFHDGTTSADEAAYAITRPISTFHVPDLGQYSNESFAIDDLWRLLITALMEWPSARVPDLFALLDAIGKVPDKLYLGEATDSEGKELLSWAGYPWIGGAWLDAQRPGEVVRRLSDPGSIEKVRKVYIRYNSLEAQFAAKQYFRQNMRKAVKLIGMVLEGEPDDGIPQDEASAYHQIRLDFDIPVVSSWMRYRGDAIFKYIVLMEGGLQRWLSWEKRLQEIKEQESDGQIKMAAASALKDMEAARADS